MMLRTCLLLGWVLCSAVAQAQALQQQIDAVAAVQAREQATRQEWLREQAARQERAAAQQRAAEAARERASAAEAKAGQEEAAADKRREQQFEDRVRELAIREKELELKQLEARTKREDEYIDQDLARQRAATDVVQSQADGNRQVSSGIRTFLQGAGGTTTQVEHGETRIDSR
ncbi:MAG: DUF5384 family protein [Acetobacteraceae bacterium]|nr:DUF5384 family protein [Acetobacteraceae bacterium]